MEQSSHVTRMSEYGNTLYRLPLSSLARQHMEIYIINWLPPDYIPAKPISTTRMMKTSPLTIGAALTWGKLMRYMGRLGKAYNEIYGQWRAGGLEVHPLSQDNPVTPFRDLILVRRCTQHWALNLLCLPEHPLS